MKIWIFFSGFWFRNEASIPVRTEGLSFVHHYQTKQNNNYKLLRLMVEYFQAVDLEVLCLYNF